MHTSDALVAIGGSVSVVVGSAAASIAALAEDAPAKSGPPYVLESVIGVAIITVVWLFLRAQGEERKSRAEMADRSAQHIAELSASCHAHHERVSASTVEAVGRTNATLERNQEALGAVLETMRQANVTLQEVSTELRRLREQRQRQAGD